MKLQWLGLTTALALGVTVGGVSAEPGSLIQLLDATEMAVYGQVERVDNDVALMREVDGKSSLVPARVVTFAAAELWTKFGRQFPDDFVIEQPSNSLGVEKLDKVAWLLARNPDGLWDFVDERSSYFSVVVDSSGNESVVSLRQNRGLWGATLWSDPLLRSRVEKHLAVDESHRTHLLKLGDQPWVPKPLPLSLFRALLDEKFARSSR